MIAFLIWGYIAVSVLIGTGIAMVTYRLLTRQADTDFEGRVAFEINSQLDKNGVIYPEKYNKAFRSPLQTACITGVRGALFWSVRLFKVVYNQTRASQKI